MPDTDDNGNDQPGIDPSNQPGAAAFSDETSKEPDTGETEDSADHDATEASQAATDTGDSEDEPFPPRGVLTLRALRWGGLIGGVVFAVTTLVLRRGLVGTGDLIPDKVSALTICMIVGGILAWPSLTLRDKKRPVLVTILTTIMAALGVMTSASLIPSFHDAKDTIFCQLIKKI